MCCITKSNYNISFIFHLLDDFVSIDRPTQSGERTMLSFILI
jgi:hypothetical protein